MHGAAKIDARCTSCQSNISLVHVRRRVHIFHWHNVHHGGEEIQWHTAPAAWRRGVHEEY